MLPSGLDQLLYAVQGLGITPIITHPERQIELQRPPDLLRPLIERGILVQVTASSIEGSFGDTPRKCAMLINHPLAPSLLQHDVETVNAYFTRLGVQVYDNKELTEWVKTGEA